MKRAILSLMAFACIGIFTSQAQQQHPNGSFETGQINNWFLLQGRAYKVPSVNIGTTKLNPEDGSFFAFLQTDTVTYKGQTQKLYTSILASFVPYTDRPSYFRFYYGYLPAANNDSFGFVITLTKHNPSNPTKPIIVGRNVVIKGGSTTPWTRYSSKINYTSAVTPDSMIIYLYSSVKSDALSTATTTRGTSLLIDNIAFSNSDPNTGIEEQVTHMNTSLYAYPNPFTGLTNIHYNVTSNDHITLSVYDVTGREVSKLVDGVQAKGQYDVKFDAANLKNGVYFYRLQAGNSVETGKLMLDK